MLCHLTLLGRSLLLATLKVFHVMQDLSCRQTEAVMQ